MTRSIGFSCLLVTFAPALLAGCGESQPPLEITTRAGGTFVLAHPVADYERICQQGYYSLRGDPDKRGLRIRLDADGPREDHLPNAGDAKSAVVAWTEISEIAFEQPVGDLGASEFCKGVPDAIAATIRYRDGHQERRRLIDTTDEGILGATERGRVSIPLRAIARLKPVEDKGWDWVKRYEADPLERDRARAALVLRVTTDDGQVVDLRSANFFSDRNKVSGNQRLELPPIDAWELIVFIAGARFNLAWPDLARVEIADPDKLTARIVYADGRAETATVPRGELNTTFDGGHSVDMEHVKRIDVIRPGP